MDIPRILSIQVGLPKQFGAEGATDPMDRPWTTGFFKEPIAGTIHLGKTNLVGDGQADLVLHGGPEKAVLAYAASHYPHWQQELGLSNFPYGAFGENFTILGQTEAEVCIGDIFAVGEAQIQVSQPREPCWKLARRWRMKDLPKRVIKTGRSGWYFRVLSEGLVESGLPLLLLDRPLPQWSIAQVNHAFYQEKKPCAELAACPLLASSWRRCFSMR
ncbi:MOSC domain-containing protein [Synechococcales cyanobacterium C]|uniref:MOSC domain-containing protein n=1 Tax=Petrachloros mirabilis ULC683 TaxID=2781853 RepID=A0A8K2A970_9CYAN|nr:MOSC domain-containing protein [Petrachloros mirabilis]NCJ07685.1 MOSC domain-containing protein [Petrachloros mirabilis ULC683]